MTGSAGHDDLLILAGELVEVLEQFANWDVNRAGDVAGRFDLRGFTDIYNEDRSSARAALSLSGDVL